MTRIIRILLLIVLLLLTSLVVGQSASGNFLTNHSFESGLDNWQPKHLTAEDGVKCDGHQATGLCSLKLVGDGVAKSIKQTVLLVPDDLGVYSASMVVTYIEPVIGGELLLSLKMYHLGELVNEASVVTTLKTTNIAAYHVQITSYNQMIDKLVVTIKFRASSGAVYIDETWLGDKIP